MNARRVNAAALVLNGAMRGGRSLPASLAVALDAAGMLQAPGEASETVRLRIFADATERKHAEIRELLTPIELVRDGAAVWDLARAVLARLDGPPSPAADVPITYEVTPEGHQFADDGKDTATGGEFTRPISKRAQLSADKFRRYFAPTRDAAEGGGQRAD